jgi:hypothetical protein
MKMVVFWVILIMEAVSTSETSINFYQTTRHYNSEDSRLNSRCFSSEKLGKPRGTSVWFGGNPAEIRTVYTCIYKSAPYSVGEGVQSA